MLAMSLTDVFVIGAGFGIYLNNRTWIEGWDVELAFKRLARRLTKTAMRAADAAVIADARGFPCPGGTDADPAQEIREVKADPEFKVHTVIDKMECRRHVTAVMGVAVIG